MSDRTAEKRTIEINRKKGLCNTDIISYFTKGILVFMLVYGSVGGFMSAYDISYDKITAAMIIGITALSLSAIYSSGRKSMINAACVAIIILYFLIGIKSFWYINSGYYAVVNRIYEEARQYLGIFNGTEYFENIKNQYVTVTYFVVFIGAIDVVLLNIHFNYGTNLLKVVFLTLPLHAIPVYFELVPDMIYIILLFTGYLSVWIAGSYKAKKQINRQLKYIIPVVFILMIISVRIVNAFIPRTWYDIHVKQNKAKEVSENEVKGLMLFGISSLFWGGESNAGISGGRLGGISMVRPDYETDLIIRYTPYSMEPVYLKAFTAMEYDGDRWYSCYDGEDEAEYDKIYRDEIMSDTAEALKEKHRLSQETQGRGIMEVVNVGASGKYLYYPYYTDFTEMTVDEDGNASYVYYPSGDGKYSVNADFDPGYLNVPESCYRAVQTICTDGGFHGSGEEIAKQVTEYFDENYTYTLKPGYMFGKNDYITYFLINNKKGYCAHFASAATMIFRYMGIPARYVEGYVFTYNDVTVDGELVETALYDDYYEGYSGLGRTGLISLEIPDANAHAWVEIFVDGKGWIVVDPTPAASPDDSESFWEVFRYITGKGPDYEDEDNAGIGGMFTENAVNTLLDVLLCAAAAVICAVMLKSIYEWKKQASLTRLELVAQEYKKLVSCVEKKHKEFGSIKTIRERVQWINVHYSVKESDDVFAENLYRALFGPENDSSIYENLIKDIKIIRKQILKNRFQ